MFTADPVPSLIDDTEFLAQLDALELGGIGADAEDEAGAVRDHHQVRPKSAEHERSRPFWEERMRESAAAFTALEDPEPALPPPTIVSRATALLGLMACTAAGAGAAALVFHERLAHLLR